MKQTLIFFAVATLAPLPVLIAAGFLGGIWIWLAFLYLTFFTFLLDAWTPTADPMAPSDQEFPAADWLSILLGLLHFPLLAFAVWAVSGGSELGFGARILLFLSFGLYFGQVSIPNAHELIHKAQRSSFELGKWVFISLLFGHHTSAHRLVHHRFVGSADDPNSALLGQSLYSFVVTAWVGSFQLGLAAENQRREAASLSKWGNNPYIAYVLGAFIFVALSDVLAGPAGIFSFIALALYATLQLLMSDFVQHYGLTRLHDEHGNLEPVGPQHSWNAPHWFSSRLMLNAPRHSDHHTHPLRSFPALTLAPNVPMLPYSLPVMGFISLFPRRWRHLMDREAVDWMSRESAAD